MKKQRVRIKGDLNRADTLSVKAIDENGNEINIGCYKFIIESDVNKVVSKVVLYCHGVEIDVDGLACITDDGGEQK